MEEEKEEEEEETLSTRTYGGIWVSLGGASSARYCITAGEQL